MPPGGVIRLAAAAMTDRTGYPATTAEWAVTEFAVALGLAAPTPTVVPDLPDHTESRPAPLSEPPAGSPVPPRPKMYRGRAMLLGACAGMVLVAVAAGAYLLGRPHASQPSSVPPSTPVTSPATSPAAASTRPPAVPPADFRVCTDLAFPCTPTRGMQAEPPRIYLAADGSGFITRMVWTGWGTATATGTGSYEIDNCMPNCAQGTYTGYPATVTLSRPELYPPSFELDGYTRILVSAPSAPGAPDFRTSVYPSPAAPAGG